MSSRYTAALINEGNRGRLESARLEGPRSRCRAAHVLCSSVVELIAGGVRPRWLWRCSQASLTRGHRSACLDGTRSRCGAGQVWFPSAMAVHCCLASLTRGHGSARLEGTHSRCGAGHVWCPFTLVVLCCLALLTQGLGCGSFVVS